MPYQHVTIAQFVAAVGDRSPAPASGSTVAVTAALAAALVELTARFSDDMEALGAAVRQRERLLALADEDADAYAEFVRTKSEAARALTIAVPQEIADRAAAV